MREDLKIPEGDLGKDIESKHEAGEEILVSGGTSFLSLLVKDEAGCGVCEHISCHSSVREEQRSSPDGRSEAVSSSSSVFIWSTTGTV